MGRLFGTNGVRGVANKEFTIELVTRLAASCGHVLGEDIALGRDGRVTSPLFRDAAASGLLSVGCNVHDLGTLPTPALQYAVKRLGLDGGLMITASHNPPEFNGVKVMAADGVEIPRRVEDEIEGIHFAGGPKAADWDRVGEVRHSEVLNLYVDAVVSKVDVSLIKGKHLRVALDPGNGVGTLVAPTVAQRLGCQVYTVNAELDGRFPGRQSEPRPDNLGDLKELVKATGADIGVAFDGDADRSIFLDERGEVLWGDRSFALVASYYMDKHPGAKVATAVSSSNAIVEVVEAAGGSIHWTRVGSVDVSRAMVENGIDFGGEENGGVMYGPHHPVRDGSMTMALILNIMAERDRPLSKLVAELPTYAQAKDKVRCPNELKQRVLEALRAKVAAPRVDTMDGLKLVFGDGSWILVRPSGTEPIFRLYAEADTQPKVEMLVSENKRLIEETVKAFSA
ncbi:MAG: phosphoglucosamine mutase [Candidatus Bathyarchaeota archaeon]|nr:phosphoglucosamine mutase [Candidatus Bathyarchaeota archaeon]